MRIYQTYTLLLLGVLLTTGSISIQFNEMGLVSQELDVYYPNGTLVSSISTNNSITLNDNNSYQITIRPERINYLRDPGQSVNLLLEYWKLVLSIVVFAWFIRTIIKD
jgi:hypothetical protein